MNYEGEKDRKIAELAAALEAYRKWSRQAAGVCANTLVSGQFIYDESGHAIGTPKNLYSEWQGLGQKVGVLEDMLPTHDAQVSAAARKPLLEALRRAHAGFVSIDPSCDHRSIALHCEQKRLEIALVLDRYNEDGTEKE